MKFLAFALLLLGPQDDDKDLRSGLRYLSRNLPELLKNTTVKFDERTGTPYNTTAAALGGLALLAGGRHEDSVKAMYAHVKDYVRRAQRQNLKQENWPVAFAGFFLAELTLRGDKEAGKELDRVIRILESAQKENGGWGHHKVGVPKKEWERYPETLTSSTSLVLACLGLLKHRLERRVDDKVLARGLKFLEGAKMKDGGYAYDVTRRMFGSEAGRTAGVLFALSCLKKEDEEAQAYVEKHKDKLITSHGSSAYHTLLSALAGFDVPDMKPREDGSFACVCPGRGDMCNEARHEKVIKSGRMTPEATALFRIQVRCYITALYAVTLQRKSLKLFASK